MPSKNSVKIYAESSYYHVYNRGVEGRNIFGDHQDYRVFLSFIKRYLLPPTLNEVRPRWKQDLAYSLELKCYTLMPNHFHFLIRLINKNALTIFMRALMDSYVKFFNKKYKREGGLFQGKFKAVLVENDIYLLHLTRYIHLNPLKIGIPLKMLEDYYCSYGEFIGKRNTEWIKPKEILDNFGSSLVKKDSVTSYRDFVEKYEDDSENLLDGLMLE